MNSEDEIEAIGALNEASQASESATVQQNIAAANEYAAAETQNEINAQASFEQILTGQVYANNASEANLSAADAQFMGTDVEDPMPPVTQSPTQQYHDIGMAAMEAVESAPSSAQIAANDVITNMAASNQIDTPPIMQPPQDTDTMGETAADSAARGTVLYQSGAFMNGAVGGGIAVNQPKGPSTGGSDSQAGTLPDDVVPDVEDVGQIPAEGAVGGSSRGGGIVVDRFRDHLEHPPGR